MVEVIPLCGLQQSYYFIVISLSIGKGNTKGSKPVEKHGQILCAHLSGSIFAGLVTCSRLLHKMS